MMQWSALLNFAPLIVMLICAACTDLHSRRIPNWLTLTIAATGLMQSLTPMGTVAPYQAVLGLLAGLGLTIGLFILGALNGGDVKLLAGAGSWLGAGLLFQIFLATAIVGMIIVIGQCLWQRRLGQLLKNSVLIIVNLRHIRQVGVEHARTTGQSCRSVGKPLPYAVPVLVAALTVLSTGRGLI